MAGGGRDDVYVIDHAHVYNIARPIHGHPIAVEGEEPIEARGGPQDHRRVAGLLRDSEPVDRDRVQEPARPSQRGFRLRHLQHELPHLRLDRRFLPPAVRDAHHVHADHPAAEQTGEAAGKEGERGNGDDPSRVRSARRVIRICSSSRRISPSTAAMEGEAYRAEDQTDLEFDGRRRKPGQRWRWPTTAGPRRKEPSRHRHFGFGLRSINDGPASGEEFHTKVSFERIEGLKQKLRKAFLENRMLDKLAVIHRKEVAERLLTDHRPKTIEGLVYPDVLEPLTDLISNHHKNVTMTTTDS